MIMKQQKPIMPDLPQGKVLQVDLFGADDLPRAIEL
jgi:hypothetical protein